MKRLIAFIAFITFTLSVFSLPHEIIDSSRLNELMEQDPYLAELRRDAVKDANKRKILLTAAETPLTVALVVFLEYMGTDDGEESSNLVKTGVVTGLISAPLWYLLGSLLSQKITKPPVGNIFHRDLATGELVEAAALEAAKEYGAIPESVDKMSTDYYLLANYISVKVVPDGYLAVFDTGRKDTVDRYYISLDGKGRALVALPIDDAAYVALLGGASPAEVIVSSDPVAGPAGGGASPFDDAAPEVRRYIDPYAAAPVFDLGGGKTLYAFALTGASVAEGLIVGRGGAFASGKLKDGVLEGVGVIGNYLDGRHLSGTFVNGEPEGVAVFKDSAGGSETFAYSNGRRDLSRVPRLSASLRELKDLKASALLKLKDGVSVEDMDDLLIEIADKRATVKDKLGPEDLLSAFSSGEGVASVTTADGVTWNLAELTEDVIRDSDGRVISIERRSVSTAEAGFAVGLNVSTETIVRQTDPVYSVANGGTAFGCNFATVPDAMTLVGLTFGVNYRKFSNGGNAMPGPEGGKGGGFDFRVGASGTASMMSMKTITYSGWTPVESNAYFGFGGIDLSGIVGWTSFRFGPMDEQELTQAGKGWSLGLKASYSLPLSSEDLGDYGGGFELAPALSFDKYAYNQATAKYSSTSTTIFAWPVPLSISILVNSSF